MARTKVKSQITGGVWKIEVEVGAVVDEGDVLILIESMKMEVPVAAPKAGTVVSILVAEDDQVVEGQVVAEIDS